MSSLLCKHIHVRIYICLCTRGAGGWPDPSMGGAAAGGQGGPVPGPPQWPPMQGSSYEFHMSLRAIVLYVQHIHLYISGNIGGQSLRAPTSAASRDRGVPFFHFGDPFIEKTARSSRSCDGP